MTDDHHELFSGGKAFTLGAATEPAEGLQVLAPREPTLPSRVLPHFSFSAPTLAGSRSAENRELSPSISLPVPSPAYLPQGAARSLPAAPRLPREQGHADTASPCPGHARKLCLTLQTAQPSGTKNRPCARLDVFLSAGYTPSPVQFFPLVEQRDAGWSRGWCSTGCPERLCCGPGCHGAGQPPGNTP